MGVSIVCPFERYYIFKDDIFYISGFLTKANLLLGLLACKEMSFILSLPLGFPNTVLSCFHQYYTFVTLFFSILNP